MKFDKTMIITIVLKSDQSKVYNEHKAGKKRYKVTASSYTVDERYHISKVGPVFSQKWWRYVTHTLITYHSRVDSNYFNKNSADSDYFNIIKPAKTDSTHSVFAK